jgi:excisionase family DNA binding protein
VSERRRRPVAQTADPFLTSAEVASLLKMPRSTVEDYARRGLLPSVKLCRHRRFVWNDVHNAVLASKERREAGTVVALPQRERNVP